MIARATNIGLRFYEIDGWTFDIINSTMKMYENNILVYYKDKFTGYFIFKKINDDTRKEMKNIITEIKEFSGSSVKKEEKEKFDILFEFHID